MRARRTVIFGSWPLGLYIHDNKPRMDFQNRAGGKTGTYGIASASSEAIERRERLRKLALESIDLQKDPYYFRNHVGQVECESPR